MTNEQEREAFEAQYGPLGADLAHNYERGYLNPMTRELFACWCAALASQAQEPVARAVAPPEFQEVSWGVDAAMRPVKGMAVSDYAFRQWAADAGITLTHGVTPCARCGGSREIRRVEYTPGGRPITCVDPCPACGVAPCADTYAGCAPDCHEGNRCRTPGVKGPDHG